MQKISIILATLILLSSNISAKDKVSTQEAQKVLSDIAKEKEELGINLISKNINVGVTTENEIEKSCEEIMGYLAKGKLKEAFDTIKALTWLPEAEMDLAYSGTKKQLDLFGKRYGKPVGFELVKKETLSPSLIKFIYLEKRENHPLV